MAYYFPLSELCVINRGTGFGGTLCAGEGSQALEKAEKMNWVTKSDTNTLRSHIHFVNFHLIKSGHTQIMPLK